PPIRRGRGSAAARRDQPRHPGRAPRGGGGGKGSIGAGGGPGGAQLHSSHARAGLLRRRRSVRRPARGPSPRRRPRRPGPPLGGAIGEEGILRTAVEMEGHPDNVVPSLRGGAQVSVRTADGRVVSCAIPLKLSLRAALFIPHEELATSAARAVLPKQVSLEDA